MQVHRLASVAILVVAGLTVGCGQKTLPTSQTYPVKGRVLLKGEPASYVIVEFSPTGKEGVDAVGRTDKDGYFELRTYSNEGNDGAVPGEYKVTISDYNPVKGGALPQGAKGITVPGGSMASGQTYTIDAGDNDLTVEVP